MSDLNEYGETLEEVSRSRNNWEHMAGKYLKWRDQHRDRADALERKLKLCVEALEAIKPFLPVSSPRDNRHSAHVRAADMVRKALEEAGK